MSLHLCAQGRWHQPHWGPPQCPHPGALHCTGHPAAEGWGSPRASAMVGVHRGGAPPRPVSPPGSVPAPATARCRPRLDISLQALQLCSFPWQQQTPNYRYIILYKPHRARGQEQEAHLLAAFPPPLPPRPQRLLPRERGHKAPAWPRLAAMAAPRDSHWPRCLSGGSRVNPSTSQGAARLQKFPPGERGAAAPFLPRGLLAEVAQGRRQREGGCAPCSSLYTFIKL